MTQLIYHPVTMSPTPANEAPFEAAILGMASSKTLKIACPYVSHERLERILQDHTDWKLVTDIDALLRSLRRADRQSFIKLFRKNQRRVRHNKDLHAKVFIADQQALVGPANLTEMGLAVRAEMSVLMLDQRIVDELDTWFEGIWEECDELTQKSFKEMARFADALPARSSKVRETGKLLLPPGPQWKATLRGAASPKKVKKTIASTRATRSQSRSQAIQPRKFSLLWVAFVV